MATQQALVTWTGEHTGHTLDSAHSFATVYCDDTGTLMLFGHLYQTNQVSVQLHLYYKLDGSAPIDTGVFFPTGTDGTADFAFSVKGIPSGSHAATIEVNHTAPELTYYLNQAAINDANTGIPFTSPGAHSQFPAEDALIPFQGGTIDSTHSFVTAQCDNTDTLIVFGHVSGTNQPNAHLPVTFSVDYTPTVQYTLVTNAAGTGDFAFSVEGLSSDYHYFSISIFDASGVNCLYINQGDGTSPGSGTPFQCP